LSQEFYTKYVEENELELVGMDKASTKTIGQSDANNNVFNKSVLYLTKQKIGVDSSSQFANPFLFINAFAYSYVKGDWINENGKPKFVRSKTRNYYALIAPAKTVTGNAFDVFNGNEKIHTNCTSEKEMQRLLHVTSANDDLKGTSLQFKMSFLKYKTRLKLFNILK